MKKPVKGWCLFCHDEPILRFVHTTRIECIQDAEFVVMENWKEMKKRGYSVRKISVREGWE